MSIVYYCNSCREKRRWPVQPKTRETRCAFCREYEHCYAVDSAKLPAARMDTTATTTHPDSNREVANQSTDIDASEKVVRRPLRKPLPKNVKKGSFVVDENVDITTKSEMTYIPQEKETIPSIDVLALTAEDLRKLAAERSRTSLQDTLSDILTRMVGVCEAQNLTYSTSHCSSLLIASVVSELMSKGFDVETEKDHLKITW